MDDVNQWKMNGPVRTLRREFAEWNPEIGEWQPPRGLTVVTFRPDGQLREREYHNPDGPVARHLRLYNDSSRVTEDEWRTNDALTNRVVHWYDVAGRPASATEIRADGTRREAEIYRYDDVGRKTKVVFLSVPEWGTGSRSRPIGETHYGVEGTDVAYAAPGATTNTIIYDDRELPLTASFHDANQALVRRVVFSRDRDGRLVSERLEIAGAQTLFDSAIEVDKLPDEERARLAELLTAASGEHAAYMATYAYDEKGRLRERVRRIGHVWKERATFQYDDRGNPVEEVTVDLRLRMDEGVVKIDDELPRGQHARFDYQYDAYDNWTERVVWQRVGPSSDDRRSGIERRTITYYSRDPTTERP